MTSDGNSTSKTDEIDAADINPMQRLEEALVVCRFGKFHIKLLFVVMTAIYATTMVTTTTSYMLSNAECDLHISFVQKGLLNAMPFFGQVGGTCFTGFLIDTFGRKTFLFGGNIGMFLCSILQGSSQNFWMLVVAKAIDGLFLSFTYSAVQAITSEFTHKDVRDRVLLLTAAIMSTSLIAAALMSWAILPRAWDFVIVEGYFELHSWNIYLYVSSIWSLLAAIGFYFLPESPKFLLSRGREEEALKILKDVYHENTGLDRDTFPFMSLVVPGVPEKKIETTLMNQFRSALGDVKQLFQRPLVYLLLLFSGTFFTSLLTYTSLRLWFPQLSTIIENFDNDNNTAFFCDMINDYTQRPVLNTSLSATVTDICIPKISGAETYINGIILGCASLVCLLCSVYLVNILGQKILAVMTLLLSATCSASLYWTYNSVQIALLISTTVGLIQAGLSLMNNIVVRSFPTSVRALSFSLIMMTGRIGSLVGSVIFPIMLQGGCMTPFLSLSVVNVCVAFLVIFFPDPNKKGNNTGDR